uniref:Giant-lens protein n=2 Tax=Aphidini TaxID=33387 RepID=A0A2S2NZA0_SCHGA
MLPKCRYFRDMAWTLRSEGNGTLQTVHCHCPKGSVAYLLKRQAYQTESKQIGYQYSFACSPQSRLRCQRKEPCRLFTVRKRQEMVDEVNTNTLCQCPPEHACPSHHTDAGVIQSKNYSEENIRTYSGYCMQPSTN